MARGYQFDLKWVCPMRIYAWGIQVFCSRWWFEMRWFLISNRTLEYLRHNFPLDRLISRQTDNPWPSYSKDLNLLTIFWGGTWKTEFVKTIYRQESTSSEKESDRLHKKCSIELWTILLFELLLMQQHSTWNEHSINYWESILKHYWF